MDANYREYCGEQSGPVAAYLEAQAEMIQCWIYDAVIHLVQACRAESASNQASSLGGWAARTQICASAAAVLEMLNAAACDGVDPYVFIRTATPDEVADQILCSRDSLLAHLAAAQHDIDAETRAREEYLYGGGLARENERILSDWRRRRDLS